MRWRRWSLVLVGLALVAAACGGDGETPPGGNGAGTSPPCAPSGTTVKVTAQDVSFDTECLAAPADTAFTIEFANQDLGTSHSVAIYRDESASETLFSGEIVTGITTTGYSVPALAAGTYFFRCDVHPQQMNGTFVVAAA